MRVGVDRRPWSVVDPETLTILPQIWLCFVILPDMPAAHLSHIFPWERSRGALVALRLCDKRAVRVRVLRVPPASRGTHVFAGEVGFV